MREKSYQGLATYLPTRRLFLWLALRYGFIDKSILVVTEGLGPQKFHGRVAILVNEHTASAGEMLAAFAEENGLATIVGTKDGCSLAEWLDV